MAKEKKQTRKPRIARNIYERIYNVQCQLKTVLKSTEHAHNKYLYATERDFIAEVKPLMAQERLALHSTTRNHSAAPNHEGVNQHTIEVMFTLVNIDNPAEKIESVYYGVGDDKKGSVVGLPIAYTMAMKYYLAKTFIAETGNDAEAQDGGEGKKAGKGKGAVSDAPTETPEQATETIKRMLAGSRNVDGMRDYVANRLPSITKLSAAQKADIKAAAEKRIAELEAGETIH